MQPNLSNAAVAGHNSGYNQSAPNSPFNTIGYRGGGRYLGSRYFAQIITAWLNNIYIFMGHPPHVLHYLTIQRTPSIAYNGPKHTGIPCMTNKSPNFLIMHKIRS